MGYDWLPAALDALSGVEPYEVLQALDARRRRPVPARTPGGIHVLTIWARTRAGRPLIVAVRQTSRFDWLIVGARSMAPAELAEFEEWEAE